jgi:hypothetical protein
VSVAAVVQPNRMLLLLLLLLSCCPATTFAARVVDAYGRHTCVWLWCDWLAHWLSYCLSCCYR